MKRLAVYTVQTGSKGDFDGFGVGPSTDFDFILFTDDPDLRAEGCATRLMDTHGLDPARSCRCPKLLPHRYLADYEWSLYVDANAKLKADPERLLSECEAEHLSFFSFRHPDRDCLYAEAEVVIRQDYDDERRVREQIDHYRKTGFPCHSGLIAGSALLRRHNDAQAIAVGEEWYEHVLRFSSRDQLSFNFVAWRRAFRHGFFQGGLRDNPYILWPARPRNQRITADFDPEVYAWLNPEVETSELSPQEHFLRKRAASGKDPRYKRHSWQLRKLANKHRSDKGDIYYNAHNYSDIYEIMLRDKRDSPLRLLEIGLLRHDVQAKNPAGPYAQAPSLAMWREYLPKAEIYGFDIADFSTMPELPGVQIVRGDMSDEADLRRLIEVSGGEFDVIIDDASHASHHQQIALRLMFFHLKPAGFYCIEDLTYQPPQIEQSDAIKTLDVLRSLSCGSIRPTPYIDRTSLELIQASLDWLHMFDSNDRNFGKIHRDAFAVLKKAKSPRKPSKGPMSRLWPRLRLGRQPPNR
jgi:Protein of unknown function (DUF616)